MKDRGGCLLFIVEHLVSFIVILFAIGLLCGFKLGDFISIAAGNARIIYNEQIEDIKSDARAEGYSEGYAKGYADGEKSYWSLQDYFASQQNESANNYSESNSSNYVYVTPYGECYHSTPDCPSLRHSDVIDKIELKYATGRRACSKCY